MTRFNDGVAVHWGDVIRRARLALGLRQVDVALAAELSRNLVSRMELGAGGSIPLRSWVSVAGVLNIRLDAASHADARWMRPIERRCHALVAELGREGGWSAVTEIGRRGETWRVSGLILVPRTARNRRRITERAADIAPRLPADVADWLGSLRRLRQPMPADRGLAWLDRWATRFTPARRRPGWQKAV